MSCFAYYRTIKKMANSYAYILYLITASIICYTVAVTINSVQIKDSVVPTKGSTIQLVCSISGFTLDTAVSLYKTDTPTIAFGTRAQVQCIANTCINGLPGYTYSSDDSHIYVNITHLSQSTDGKWWTCLYGTQMKALQLVVYSIPQSLTYGRVPSEPQDLSNESVILECKTVCVYPTPKFGWFYSKSGASRQLYSTSGVAGVETHSSCTDSEKLYTSVLTLARYTTFAGNANETVKFECGIREFPGLPTALYTPLSPDITFSVKTTSVTLKDGPNQPTNNSLVTVTSGVPKTLTCSPSLSRPAATVVWYLDNVERQRSTSTNFTFTPLDNDHDKHLYCKGFNIPPESEAVLSLKYKLFVQVQVSSVTISPGTSGTLEVANGDATTLTCTPGTSRPEATVVWYMGTVKQATTGTRFSFTPTSRNHGEDIYCKTYNIQLKSQAVSSNKIKLYVRDAPRATTDLTTNFTGSIYDNVTLIMTVVAYPAPSSYVWSKLTGGISYSKITPGQYINILTHDRRSELIITDIQESHFGQYKIKVDNGVGIPLTQLFFINKQDRPEVPTEFQPLHETTTVSTITIQWTPGYNGGLPQTFYVLYRPYSSDTWNIENKTEPATNMTLQGLAAGGMKYEVQIYSQNSIGKSYTIGPKVFITLGMVNTNPEVQDTVPLIIGAYVGGLFTAVVIVITVLLMRRFNIVDCNACNRKETTQRQTSSKPNDQQEYENTAISTTDEYENEIMLEAIKGDSAYETTAPVNKTEHLYSDIGPSSSNQENYTDKAEETEESMEAYVNV